MGKPQALYLFANIADIAPNTTLLINFVAMILLSINSLAALLEGKAGWFGLAGMIAIAAFIISTQCTLFSLGATVSGVVAVYIAMCTAVRLREQGWFNWLTAS